MRTIVGMLYSVHHDMCELAVCLFVIFPGAGLSMNGAIYRPIMSSLCRSCLTRELHRPISLTLSPNLVPGCTEVDSGPEREEG